jgi:hypothetical protein
MLGFWGYLWPVNYDLIHSDNKILILMVVEHLLPWLSVVIILLMADVTVIEADWRSCVIRSLFYLPCNLTGYIDKNTATGDKNGAYG